MQCYGSWNDHLIFANWCCIIKLVHMRSGLYHSVVSNCQANHNCCLLQYTLDLWSLDFLHIYDRALFDLHQIPNLDWNDRNFNCDLPLEYDFEQCAVAMWSSVFSAILLGETLTANHLFSSQQFLVDHLHSKGVHNKMHRQWFVKWYCEQGTSSQLGTY